MIKRTTKTYDKRNVPASYSPDWAVVYREEGLKDGEVSIYFIVETKADKEQSDLTPVETSKISCGKLHFKAVSNLVKFDWVNSYKDFKEKFGVR
jgi:type III restriction enzyme